MSEKKYIQKIYLIIIFIVLIIFQIYRFSTEEKLYNLRLENNFLENQIKNRDKTIDKKQSEINALRRELSVCKRENTKHTERFHQLNKTYTETYLKLKKCISEKAMWMCSCKELDLCKTTVKSHEDTIKELNNTIKKMCSCSYIEQSRTLINKTSELMEFYKKSRKQEDCCDNIINLLVTGRFETQDYKYVDKCNVTLFSRYMRSYRKYDEELKNYTLLEKKYTNFDLDIPCQERISFYQNKTLAVSRLLHKLQDILVFEKNHCRYITKRFITELDKIV